MGLFLCYNYILIKLGEKMFNIQQKDSFSANPTILNVYDIREVIWNGKPSIEFLVYDFGWCWVNARDYVPASE